MSAIEEEPITGNAEPVRTIYPAAASGTVLVPASKSHTIRALLVAAAARGTSTVTNALDSADARSCLEAITLFGAKVSVTAEHASGIDLTITTDESCFSPGAAGSARSVTIDVGNSGTTLYLATALAACRTGETTFDGDASIRRRSAGPLLRALESLGVEIGVGASAAAPWTVRGPIRAGHSIDVESPTSQFLSALLLAAPLAAPAGAAGAAGAAGLGGDVASTTLNVKLLNEHPYIDLTCWWLDRSGIPYTRDGYQRFEVPSGAAYPPLSTLVPGDYSSATFWAVAAAIGGGPVTIDGLEPDDPQGDKRVFEILEELGCTVERHRGSDGRPRITVSGRPVRGGTFDLAAMPDAVPALAVLGCGCPEPLTLTGVAHARAKETDRLAVMREELSRLGAAVTEHPDGLTVHPAPLHGGVVESHGDHRIAMALALIAPLCGAPVTVYGAEAAAVTYPAFYEHLASLGVPVDAGVAAP